jgi:amidase
MALKEPDAATIRQLADHFGFAMSTSDVAEFRDMVAGGLAMYQPLESLPDYLPEVTYPRTPGRRPDADEDPLHAWYVKTSITGADHGPLAGRQVVIKDSVCIAGVPMMDGSNTLEGYVPDVDATVVTRILDAGGEIVGKANCEYFCYAAGSNTNATGPTRNPYRPTHTSGGSSSGCAAIVGSGEVAMAIGGDQGGSVRTPASFCGIYGMKPTHGLVPYTGIFATDHTVDHVGPMTATVADNALLLEVIAGADGLDPRQCAPVTDRYTDALALGVDGLRIGLLTEGFDQPGSEPDVDAKVRAAVARFERMGANVEEVSVPMHALSVSIWAPIIVEGALELMFKGDDVGTGWKGMYPTSLARAHSDWRRQADTFSDILKLGMLMGEYVIRNYGRHYYAKAQNLARKLTAAYDDRLDTVDLLVMPTNPMKAPPIPGPDATRAEAMTPGFDSVTNTAAFNVTGHPAMSVPCGMSDGLPIGMMLVGRRGSESTIYRAAAAFEDDVDWKTL